ncbi:MAG: peptidylprolyl isomerase [Oscillospiraceae bacterium]|jgi:peptidyl-prolyl cis-trans isomerase B (cyclophilin B)
MLKKILSGILCAAMLFCLAACGSSGSGTSASESTIAQLDAPAEGDVMATISTTKGDITIKLFRDVAPKAVENFCTLANSGYYDDVTFHKVIQDFVIQAGDPTGTGTGGESCYGGYFEDELSTELHNFQGAVGMANSGADTNGSQFYIVCGTEVSDDVVTMMQEAGYSDDIIEAYRENGGLPQLDLRYTVFGQVVSGMNVVYEISGVKVDSDYRPVKDVKIKSITIYYYGSEDSSGS